MPTRTCWIFLIMTASVVSGCGATTDSEQNRTSGQTPLPNGDSFPRISGSTDGPEVLSISESGYSCHIACRDAYSTPAILDLGRLNGGRNSSYASAISEDGKVAVGEVNDGGDGRNRAFKWSSTTGMVSLSNMGWSSAAQAVNSDGSVIVGSVAIDGDAVAFRWSAQQGMVLLTNARGPNNRSAAQGVSADGSVVVGNAGHPFRWTAATGMKPMDGGYLSYVHGLSADGSRAVGSSLSVPGEEEHMAAVYWDADGHMHPIGRFKDTGMADATAVSANGQWVAGFAQDDSAEKHNVAILWSEQTGFQTLGWLHSGGYARAYGISSDGTVVVGNATDGAYHGHGTGFRWTHESGMQSITEWVQAAGGRITRSLVNQATGVSGDGNTIVGFLHDGDPFVAVAPGR